MTVLTTALMYPGIDIHNPSVVEEFVSVMTRRATASARKGQIDDARKSFAKMLETTGRTSADRAVDLGTSDDGKIRKVYLATRTRHTPAGLKFQTGGAMRLYSEHRETFDEFFETDDSAIRNIYTRIGGGKSSSAAVGFLQQIGESTPVLDPALRLGDRSKYRSDTEWVAFGAKRLQALSSEAVDVKEQALTASQDLEDLISYYWPHIAAQTVEMARTHNANVRRLTTNQKARKEYSYAEGEMPRTPDDVAKKVRLNLHIPDLAAPLVLQFNRGFLGNSMCLKLDGLTDFVSHDPDLAAEYTEETEAKETEYQTISYLTVDADGGLESDLEYSE